MINPVVVEGRVRAGIAQGIGLALLERATEYSDASFLRIALTDFLPPIAVDVPRVTIGQVDSESRILELIDAPG